MFVNFLYPKMAVQAYIPAGKLLRHISHFAVKCPVYCFIVLLLVCSSVTAASDAAPKQSRTLEKVTLQLKWFHQFQFAGYYAAQQKGFYADEGLDVEILELLGDNAKLNPARSDSTDYATADNSIVASYANGDQLSILAAIFQHDPLVFISKKSSQIISPYEMLGKRVMFQRSTENEASLRALLYLANITDDTYIYKEHSYDKNDLIFDKVDVMSAYITDQIFYFQKKGIKLNVISPQNYGIDFYGDLLVTSMKELIEHPGRAERFKRASIKGWKYALKHQEEMIAIIKNVYHSKLSIENLRFEARETYKMIRPDQIPLGQLDFNRLRRVADIYTQLKISKPLSDDKLKELVYGSETRLSLTEEEKTWLDQHPVIRVGIDADFAPFEWLDDEQNYLGINADYVELLEKILGVKFEIIKDKSWKQTLDMARNGELDMLSDANKTPEREQYLLFSKSYFLSPIVIISDIDRGFVGRLEQLKGKDVAIEEGYFMQEILESEYPDINLVLTSNGSKALQFVDYGVVDAYIGDALYANYIIQKTGMLNLRMSGETQFRNQHRFAVTRKNPQLLTILQKALDSIPESEQEQILNKWRGLHIEQGVRVEQLIKIALAIAILFFIFIFWLFRLNKEIRQRKQVEQALQQSESRFRMIFESTDAISIQGYNKNHQVIYWNPASEQLYGYSQAEAKGRVLEELIVPPKMRAQVRAGIDDWINGGAEIPSAEVTLQKSDGSPVHVFSSHVLLHDHRDEPELYCIDIDISLRKAQEDKIKHQAYFDYLTNLPNRQSALERLVQLLSDAQRKNEEQAGQEKVAVLFLDLDDFKKINDTLGHETGDKLLIEAAERLSQVIRAGDTVGRLGGDEFILLLGGLSGAEDAQPIAEKLLNQFRKPFKIDSRDFILTASVGIAIYPDDGDDPSELLRNADSAMYHSKKQGCNTYSYFTDSMNQEVSRRLELEAHIHGALERDEFEVYYQPKVEISSGKIVGAEALLRWHNPDLGHVSPVEFIPVCEQTDLIISIGKFVMSQALQQTVLWQKNRQQSDKDTLTETQADFFMAVNLSPRQFRDPGLLQSVEDIIHSSGASAASLELEITEGVLMSGHSYIDNTLSALSKLGITIAMDDYGTGYSSLSYLRRYPFNVLKIDRSFVNDITVDPKDRQLVNAAIAMAHALNLKVVAEGVETQEQLQLLIDMGCDIAQGYLYSKPVTAAEFSKLLAAETI